MKKYRIKQPHEQFGNSDKMPWNRNTARKGHYRENNQYIKRSDFPPTIYGKQHRISNKGTKVVHVDLSLDTNTNHFAFDVSHGEAPYSSHVHPVIDRRQKCIRH